MNLTYTRRLPLGALTDREALDFEACFRLHFKRDTLLQREPDRQAELIVKAEMDLGSWWRLMANAESFLVGFQAGLIMGRRQPNPAERRERIQPA